MPLVSVIIPSYNHEKYITEAIQSVLTQSMIDLELIVVDDGSTDSSIEKIRSFKDKRIIVKYQDNSGAHDAINRGISLSKGEYISILNSDDVYKKNRLESLVSFAQQNDVSLLSSYIEVIDSAGKSLGIKEGFRNMHPYTIKNAEKSFLYTNCPARNLLVFNYLSTTSNFLFSRKVWKSIGSFKQLRYTHDWDFALRAAREFPMHIVEVPLVKYRVHGDNTISENQARMILEICWTMANNYADNLNNILLQRGAHEAYEDTLIQAYHSMQAFNCDRILAFLGLAISSQRKRKDHSFSPEDILDPSNTVHQMLVSEIQNHIKNTDEESGAVKG